MSARKSRSRAAMRAERDGGSAEKEAENPKPMDPEGWPRYKAKLAGWYIDSRRILFEKSRNPVHAMNAYRIAREVKIDIPDWVLEFFDQWAEVLCVKRPMGAKGVADALGLGAKGGGPSIMSQSETQARSWWIVERVLVLRDLDPKRDKLDVFHQVAEEFNLSSEHVAGIWYNLTGGVKH